MTPIFTDLFATNTFPNLILFAQTRNALVDMAVFGLLAAGVIFAVTRTSGRN